MEAVAKTNDEPHLIPNVSGVEPLGDLILVKLLEMQETTAGGIIIANVTLDKEALSLTTAQVIRLGPNAREFRRAKDLQEGELIDFAKYAGYLFKGDDSNQYRLIRPDDCLGRRGQAPKERPRAAVSSVKAFDIDV